MEALIGNAINRILPTRGIAVTMLRYKFRVLTSDPKRRMRPKLKSELRRLRAVESVIGQLKSGDRMDRNYFWQHQGGAMNDVLTAVGYNFRRLIDG